MSDVLADDRCLAAYDAFLDAIAPLSPGSRVVDIGHGGPASLRHLSYRERTVDAACLVNVLERVSPSDLDDVLAEIGRVVARHLYVRVNHACGSPLAALSREEWERRFFAAGWSKHPLSQRLTPYERLEHATAIDLMAFERLPHDAARRYPLDWLAAEHSLHMDMLRAAGRRSDAHVARYALAADFVREGDRVLDAACGMGYGTALLHDSAPGVTVTGVDLSEAAIAYARAAYGSRRPATAFQIGDVVAVAAACAPESFEMVASFETLEHIAEPARFIGEAARTLTPGGRFVCSVPNQWVDETGRDPNPFHLHVFDLDRVMETIEPYLRIDRVYAQFAGGGMKHPRAARRFVPVPPGAADDAEWWIVVATRATAAAGAGRARRDDVDRGSVDRAGWLAAECRAWERTCETLRTEQAAMAEALTHQRERARAKALADARGVVIFGAGQGGRQAAAAWRHRGGRVAGFTDNRAELWGTSLDGVPVVAPSDLRLDDVVLVLIASSLGAAAIAAQLEGMGLREAVDFLTWTC